MTRPEKPLLRLLTALCLVSQGVFLFFSARGAGAPHLLFSLGFLLLAALTAGLLVIAWRAGDGRRAGVICCLTAELILLLVAASARPWRAPGSAGREDEGRQALAVALQREEEALDSLSEAVSSLSGRAVDRALAEQPFPLLADLAASWRSAFAFAPRFPLGLTLWREGERVAWDEGAVPLPLFPGEGDSLPRHAIQPGSEGWYWRHLVPVRLADGEPAELELQVGLAGAESEEGSRGHRFDPAAGEGTVQVQAEVVRVDSSEPERWAGDAGQGFTLVRELELGPAGGETWVLRLTARHQPWGLQEERLASRRLMLLLVVWCVAVVSWAWSAFGMAGLVAGLVAGRGLLVGVDFFRWVQPAFPGQRLPALPGELASLVDPAYFATPLAGGWFASAADAVLSALLLAVCAWLLIRPAGDRVTDDETAASRLPSRWPLAVLFGLLAAALLLLLRALAAEIVENANARLIGPKIPFRFLSFWALHLVLLLISGTVLVLLTFLAARWRSRVATWPGLAGAILAGAAVALAAPELALASRLALAAVVFVLWRGVPRVLARDLPLRRLYLAIPFLLTVGVNYVFLAEAYGRAERSWLERKAEQIVLPQDDWIQFLMEDVLAEMTRAEPAGPADYSLLSAGLWRNRAAYDLWRGSAVRDLGLPCLVEILDDDGFTESLFASGFFRDFGYEVRARSEWRTGLSPEAALPGPVLLQTEVRRYPTGEERVMRGEVPRTGGRGRLRVELPVQSKRITTLTTLLGGASAESEPGAYRPRAEVDRPLLLLRGDAEGWLDAGPGGFPDPESAPVAAALRGNRVERGVVKVDGSAYHCLWRLLPATVGGRPGEGFLLGLQVPGLIDVLLDLSRLVLLDLLLLAGLAAAVLAGRLLAGERAGLRRGFQERFLAGYMALGLLLLLMAGMSVDRLSLERIDREARNQTRDGLAAALGQLQGMLTEQASAMAESEYIADLLVGRLAGQRPVGPFAVRQGMVFAADGRLLLDETLSDLDDAESDTLLQAARQSPLVVVDDGSELFLGTVIPIDLTAVMPDTLGGPAGAAGILPERRHDGFFFYRQRAGSDLVAGLAEIVQGEVTLRVDGQTVLASHPERVFSGLTPLMTPPAMMRWVLRHPANPYLHANPRTRLSFTGCAAVPALAFDPTGQQLKRRQQPAVLAVNFPARALDFAAQREQTVLFLAGLASLILLAAALMALLMTWNIFGPLRILVTATRRLAGGDFGAPLPESGRDEVGTLAASFGAMRDELGRARDRLAEREQFLTTVLDRVPVGVAVFDDAGCLVALNPAGDAILNDFYGRAGGDRQERAARVLAGFAEVVGPGAEGEGELRGAGGRRTLRGRLAPLELPDGRRDTMLVFEDVTEFLNNKRLALNAELARQVAHEIKNPLTPIQLSIQLLNQAYCDQAPDLDRIVTETVERILQQVTLLRSIAAEFSLLGRPDELECAEVDLETVVAKVVAGYRTADETVRPRGSPPRIAADEVPTVLAHEESLVKVLGNLMENSIDACGGIEELGLAVRWRVTDRAVTLIWEDDGPGLDSEVAGRLFDPYFSTKSTGTGLGLAICRNLLDKMDGMITLRNRTGTRGAVAEVTLPRYPGPVNATTIRPDDD